MKALPRTLAAFLSAAALLAGQAAADPAASTQNETLPLLEKAGNGVYRLGDIVVDRNARSITFPARSTWTRACSNT